MNIVIQKAETQHLQAVVEIINAGATSIRRDKEYQNWQDYEAAFNALCAALECDIYVAVDQGSVQVVGTFQIHFLKGIAFKGRPRVELESVHVRADKQGQGIGRKMMAFAEQLARDSGACVIQRTSNKERIGSHKFYQALGYEQSHLGYKRMF